MKIISQEEADEHHRVSIMGGVRGGIGGITASAIIFPILYKYTNYYRTLPAPLKAFGVVFVVIPPMIINAEHAGTAFEKAQWTGVGKQELDAQAARSAAALSALSDSERRTKWIVDHKYSLVAGAWAGCMAVTGVVLWRRKDLTGMQKVINARIIAQTATVALMVGAMGASQLGKEEKVEKKEPDHSWANILDATEREKKEHAREKLLAAHELFRQGKEDSAKVVV